VGEIVKVKVVELDRVVDQNGKHVGTVGFVLINSEAGLEGKLLESLRGIGEVKEAYSVYGVHDVVAKVEGKTMDDLKNVVGKIRSLKMARSTLTLIVVESVGGETGHK